MKLLLLDNVFSWKYPVFMSIMLFNMYPIPCLINGQLDKRNFLVWQPSQLLHNHVFFTCTCDVCFIYVVFVMRISCVILGKINYYYYYHYYYYYYYYTMMITVYSILVTYFVMPSWYLSIWFQLIRSDLGWYQRTKQSATVSRICIWICRLQIAVNIFNTYIYLRRHITVRCAQSFIADRKIELMYTLLAEVICLERWLLIYSE